MKTLHTGTNQKRVRQPCNFWPSHLFFRFQDKIGSHYKDKIQKRRQGQIKYKIADNDWAKGLIMFIKYKDKKFRNKNNDPDINAGAKQNLSPFFS